MHEVHALIRRRLPGATSARTDWMFGFQRRGVRRCECDTDIPKPGPLPHTSHTAATVDHSQRIVHRQRGKAAPASKTVDESSRSRRADVAAPPDPGSLRRKAAPVTPHGYPPPVLQALDDAAVGEWYRAAVEVLSASRSGLDDLNVFPVPDGDTGTNLLLTAQAAVAALDAEGSRTTESAWSMLARGAVLGARGNSGTILAQLLRGLADQLAGQPPADGPAFAAAMHKAADTAYSAVADPRRAPSSPSRAPGPRPPSLPSTRAGPPSPTSSERPPTAPASPSRRRPDSSRPCARPVSSTPAAPGSASCSTRSSRRSPASSRPVLRSPAATPAHHHSGEHLPHQPPAGPGSEVQYLLADSDEAAVERLQERLAALGDSLVVVGVDTPTGREWNVHVHVADVGAAIEAGIEAGRPYRISVSPLAPMPPPAPGAGFAARSSPSSPSEGLAELFRGEGVRVVTCGPRGVTEDDVLAEIIASAAHECAVLPNDAALTAVAARAATRARDARPGRRGRPHPVAGAGPRGGRRRRPRPPLRRRRHRDGRGRGRDPLGGGHHRRAGGAHLRRPLPARRRPGLGRGRRRRHRQRPRRRRPATCSTGCSPPAGRWRRSSSAPTSALGDAVCRHLATEHPTIEVTRYDGGPEGILLQVGVE